MKHVNPIFHLFRWLYPQPTDMIEDELRVMRPFSWMVMMTMLFLYVVSLYSSVDLRQPGKFILLTVLMVVHSLLHWYFPLFSYTPRTALRYLIFQGILAFTITLIGHNLALVVGLYMALIGEAIGVLGRSRLTILVIASYLGISGLSLVILEGWGSILTWALIIGPTTLFVIIYVVLFGRQVEAREKAQSLLEELKIAHRQLAEYAAQVEDLTLVAERQRMARELHDTLSQGLAGLILQLEAVDSHLSSGNGERAQSIVQQAMARARATLADARRAIGDLRETLDNPPDLAEGIREEVGRFKEATGITCTLDLTLPDELTETVIENALRAVAEGLVNAARHAQAKGAEVQVSHANGWLDIQVRDDGRGFDPQNNVGQSGHYGLLGLRERARLAGGKLEIDSAPGEGTILKLRLPLQTKVEADG